MALLSNERKMDMDDLTGDDIPTRYETLHLQLVFCIFNHVFDYAFFFLSKHSRIHLLLHVDLCMLQNVRKIANSFDKDGSHALEHFL